MSYLETYEKWLSSPALSAEEIKEILPSTETVAALVEKYSKLLYGQAAMLAGLPMDDPAEYAQLVCSLMV